MKNILSFHHFSNLLSSLRSSTNYLYFTGGGSGGHVVPLIALLEELEASLVATSQDGGKSRFPKNAIKIYYLGSHRGIERELIQKRFSVSKEKSLLVRYVPIFTGRLRRKSIVGYAFSHAKELLFFAIGVLQVLGFFACKQVGRIFSKSAHLVLSGGGFVSVAPCVAGRLLGCTVWLHEQTSVAGLANRISAWFANRVFISFRSSQKYFSTKKVVYTGYPIRDNFFRFQNFLQTVDGKGLSTAALNAFFTSTAWQEIVQASTWEQGVPTDVLRKILNTFLLGDKVNQNNQTKRILLFVGGGNGSLFMNNMVKKHLSSLVKKYVIFHQVGKNFYDEYLQIQAELKADKDGIFPYYPFGFTATQMPLILSLADAVVCRGGGGTVSELMALQKPALIIPLSFAQKNEQYYNAVEAKQQGFAEIIEEKDFAALVDSKLIAMVNEVLTKKKQSQKANFQRAHLSHSTHNPRQKIASYVLQWFGIGQ